MFLLFSLDHLHLELFVSFTVIFVFLVSLLPCLWISFIWDSIIDPHHEYETIEVSDSFRNSRELEISTPRSRHNNYFKNRYYVGTWSSTPSLVLQLSQINQHELISKDNHFCCCVRHGFYKRGDGYTHCNRWQ